MPVVMLDTNILIGLLEAHHVTLYRLAKEAEKQGVSKAHIYALAAGKSQPSMETLGTLIASLQEITGRPIEPGELLKYIPE